MTPLRDYVARYEQVVNQLVDLHVEIGIDGATEDLTLKAVAAARATHQHLVAVQAAWDQAQADNLAAEMPHWEGYVDAWLRDPTADATLLGLEECIHDFTMLSAIGLSTRYQPLSA